MANNLLNELSPFYKDLAKKTLNENAAHVPAHLLSLKRWLNSCPHLIIPQDDLFLLSFLRYTHYEHFTAQKRIDNFCSLRCSKKHEITEWFNYPSINDPIIDEYLNMGLFIPLGFMDNGVQMILFRTSVWNSDQMSQNQMRALNNMSFERFIFDQRCQIGGIGIFIDMSGTSLKQASEWSDRKTAKSSIKLMQEASPGRTKYLIFYRESKLFDFAFKLLEMWISDKMRDRIIRIKDDIEKAYKKIPELKSVMPREYGGNNCTIEELIAKDKVYFKQFYSKPSPLIGIRVDESKRPLAAQNYMKEYKDADAISMGKIGTYVQVDPGD